MAFQRAVGEQGNKEMPFLCLFKRTLFLAGAWLALFSASIHARPEEILAFGDSYIVGAPYADKAPPGFIYDYAERKGVRTVRNYGAGGMAGFIQLKESFANLPVKRKSPVIWQTSFHDIRIGGGVIRRC